MSFLEKLFPSLKRSPEIALSKKILKNEKQKNVEAKRRLLRLVEVVVDDFVIFNKHDSIEIKTNPEKKGKPKPDQKQ